MKNRRVFELRLGKVGLILFISGMSLLLFSVFLLGIVVGKQMEAYPERYSSGIPELIRDSLLAAVSRQGKSAPVVNEEKKEEPASGGTDFGLTFYDTLGGKKGGAVAGTQAGSAKHKSAGETPPPATASDAAKRETRPPVSDGDAEAKKLNPPPEGTPAEETRAQKPPAGETVPPGKGSFEVQLAAYRERPQAEELAKKFTGSGFTPRVVMKDLTGKGRWFRVIVGGFENREKAQEAADQMAGKVRGLKCVIRSSGS